MYCKHITNFHKNGSYGKDNIIRLCDLSVGKQCMNYRHKQSNGNKIKNEDNFHEELHIGKIQIIETSANGMNNRVLTHVRSRQAKVCNF